MSDDPALTWSETPGDPIETPDDADDYVEHPITEDDPNVPHEAPEE